jgi:hypothetical protein
MQGSKKTPSNQETALQMLEALHKLQPGECRVVGGAVDGKTALVVLLPMEFTPVAVHVLLEGLALDVTQALTRLGLAEHVADLAIVSVSLERPSPQQN